MKKTITMAINRLIFFRVNQFTAGWSTMAIMVAKTSGTTMDCVIYSMVNNANKPIIISVNLA